MYLPRRHKELTTSYRLKAQGVSGKDVKIIKEKNKR